MFRVLTIAREFGSGGARIARRISERLGWELLDRSLIQEIARVTQADPDMVRKYDERVDSWVHRLSRRSLWHGAFEGVAAVAPADFLDAEAVAARARNIIEAAYARGNCVIVGRGAQCVLQDHPDVFHVFVYAPLSERIARIRERMPAEKDVEELVRAIDAERAEYIRVNFGWSWSDPHLYHLLISSMLGEDEAASIIIEAVMRRGAEGSQT